MGQAYQHDMAQRDLVGNTQEDISKTRDKDARARCRICVRTYPIHAPMLWAKGQRQLQLGPMKGGKGWR